MKSIFKLTRGELVKIFKGVGVYIMTGILVVAIALFAWLYETQLGGQSIFQTILNANATLDVFDVLDGEADDIIGDDYQQVMEKIPGSEELLDGGKFNDYFKMILISNSLDELIGVMGGTNSADTRPDLDAMTFTLLKTASGINAMYSASLVSAQNDGKNAKKETDYFYNNGAYGNDYVKYIETLFVDFAKTWHQFEQAFDNLRTNPAYLSALAAYEQHLETYPLSSTYLTNELQYIEKSLMPYEQWSNSLKEKHRIASERAQLYLDVLASAAGFIETGMELLQEFVVIQDYTEISFLNTKYLYYKTNGFAPASEGRKIRSSLNQFEDNASNFEALLESYTELAYNAQILNDTFLYYDAESQDASRNPYVYCIADDYLRLATAPSSLVEMEKFMSEAQTMISRQRWEGEFFSGFRTVTAPDVLTDDYYAEVMGEQITNLRTSLKATITESVYQTNIEPYLSVLDEAEQLISDMEKVAADYRALSTADKKVQAAEMYRQMKRSYKAFNSKISTLRLLLQNVNLSNTVETLNYKDSQLSTIYGNQFFGSKYSIRSTITESQYFITSGELSIDYVSANTLDKGYGYMNFAWIIIYILILIFGIVIGAGQIAGEHASGTMKLLLIRPHKRWQVLLSKLIATMIVVAAFLVVAFLLSFLIGGFWGFKGTTALLIFNSTVPIKMAPFWVMSLSYIFGFLEIFVYVLIALMVSTVFKSHAGAVSVSMLIYFLALILTTVLGQFAWYKFIVFNNTNLFAYFSSGPSLNDMTFWFSFVVDIIYIGLLMFASLFTFQKRDAA